LHACNVAAHLRGVDDRGRCGKVLERGHSPHCGSGLSWPARAATAYTRPMRILGIDPGLQTTGFGVVDVEGHVLRYVASGTITTTHIERGDLPARLKAL